MNHRKIHGVVEEVDSDRRWWARLLYDGHELWAEMSGPLPAGKGPGHVFTIHRTKRGSTYLYWIEKPPFTKRRIKKARQQARRWRRLLAEPAL